MKKESRKLVRVEIAKLGDELMEVLDLLREKKVKASHVQLSSVITRLQCLLDKDYTDREKAEERLRIFAREAGGISYGITRSDSGVCFSDEDGRWVLGTWVQSLVFIPEEKEAQPCP